MADDFKRLMQAQVRKSLNDFVDLAHKPVPKNGWIRSLREALGMSSYVLADRLKCDRSNLTAMEKREKQGSITLESLEQVAQAMNCKLVYSLVPIESFDALLEKQARIVAKKKIKFINHSMRLEAQGLDARQLQTQEDDLVQELLQGDPKKLWDNDDEL